MVLGPAGDIEMERIVPIVVGAHLASEISDRPIASALAERVTRAFEHTPMPLTGVVCTDLWYLNDERLRTRPTIALGPPERNALGAYLADKLPHAYAVKNVLVVQMDLPAGVALASCWGESPARTADAVRVFEERYLNHFIECALRQPA